MTPKVLAVVEPVLGALGTGADARCWVAWGDDPSIRYVILAPTAAGLVTCHVRVNVPPDGPRATAKLTRWARVQLGELAVETQAGHRIASFQVEGQVLRGADAQGDQVAGFALGLFDAMDGRPVRESRPPVRKPSARTTASGSGSRSGPKAPRKAAAAAAAGR